MPRMGAVVRSATYSTADTQEAASAISFVRVLAVLCCVLRTQEGGGCFTARCRDLPPGDLGRSLATCFKISAPMRRGVSFL